MKIDNSGKAYACVDGGGKIVFKDPAKGVGERVFKKSLLGGTLLKGHGLRVERGGV